MLQVCHSDATTRDYWPGLGGGAVLPGVDPEFSTDLGALLTGGEVGEAVAHSSTSTSPPAGTPRVEDLLGGINPQGVTAG
jgi:hypothetical protein